MPDHGSRFANANANRGIWAVRGLIGVALFMVVSACAPEPTTPGCNLQATQTVAFTGTEATDTIVAESQGAACDKAIGLFVVRTAEGYPIWSWSAPLSHRFGDAFPAEDTEHMETFLETWAQPLVTTTQAAPEWNSLAPPQTTLDQLTYNDVRARDLPMLCHFSGTARQTCVFWEPAAGGAGHLFDRDAEETEE